MSTVWRFLNGQGRTPGLKSFLTLQRKPNTHICLKTFLRLSRGRGRQTDRRWTLVPPDGHPQPHGEGATAGLADALPPLDCLPFLALTSTQALVEVVKHQKESGFAFLPSTQAGFLPKLPLETSPVGRRKAGAYRKTCFCGILTLHEATLIRPLKAGLIVPPHSLSGHLWILLVRSYPRHT